MDHVQKESASLKSKRDEATQKMSVCEARFDEFQVPLKKITAVSCTYNVMDSTFTFASTFDPENWFQIDKSWCLYWRLCQCLKVCSHLTFAFAFASTSPSKFNISSMETQMHMHRMDLNPFLTFYIDAMLNFDSDVDANANANVKCEHTIMQYEMEWMGFRPNIKHKQTFKFR